MENILKNIIKYVITKKLNFSKKNLLIILQSITYVLSIVAMLCWYDWKLLVILTLFICANNLQPLIDKIRK